MAAFWVEKSSWSAQKHLGISGLGRFAWGEAAGTRLGPGHGAPGRWQEGVGVRCAGRFKHRRPSPPPGEAWLAEEPLTAISIRWPKLVLATVLFQLVSGTKSVVGIFCFELVVSLQEQHHPPDVTDSVCALSSGGEKRRSQLG